MSIPSAPIFRLLGDVTKFTSGGTPSKNNPNFWGDEIPWISASTMKSNRVSTSDTFITNDGLANGSRLAKAGTILLLVRGSELHNRIPVAITLKDVAFNQDIKALECLPEIDPHYLLYWFMSMESVLLERVEHTGIGAGKLDTNLLKNLPIPLPPLAEQRRIADILGTLDEKIELNRRQNATLEALARALFTAWFVDFEPVRAKAEGRWRQGESLPGMPAELWELFPDSFIDSALGEIPAGWAVGTVGDLLTLQRGYDLPNSQRSNGQYEVIAASGPSGTHDKKMVDGPGVITGRSGVIGKVFFTFDDYWPLNTALWVKEFHRALPGYGYELLSRMDLAQYNAGSAVPTLNRNQVHTVPAVLPNERLIAIFETHFTLCQRTLKRNQLDSEFFSHIRDELLNELFSSNTTKSHHEQVS